MNKSCWLALACAFICSAAGAAEVTSLYTAQVPLDQERPDPRAHAYEIALAQVVLRVSGSELVNDVALFDTLFPDPAVYVTQFRPGPDDTLFVSFDGQALETVLKRAGQPVWGGDRPLTLVWIAVDWGQGEREILGAADADEGVDAARSINRDRRLRERILDHAGRRGLPVAFPLLDSEDLALVSFSDVWGGFDERVLEASRRYDVNSVLIGRIRAAEGARDRWSYFFGGDRRSFSGEPEEVISQVSDVLASEFAIGGDEPLRTVALNVYGITTVEAYGELSSTLADINLVDRYVITEVAGDRVSLEVTAHGGASRLARALRFEGLIEQERIDTNGFRPGDSAPRADEQATLDFFFSL